MNMNEGAEQLKFDRTSKRAQIIDIITSDNRSLTNKLTININVAQQFAELDTIMLR